ncbi:MAG TPA: DEAD/DEAH box helicase, partial [Verrucomicrobiae bacterium]|nr:DEAD/DEAH box helicase [Verrucomicrobiae bacterium]
FGRLSQRVPGFPSAELALQAIHFPQELDEVEPARRRLAFDEFLALQLQIQRRRRNLEQNAKGLPCSGNNSLIKPLLKRLGFQLTDAQTRVLRELRHDLGGEVPMRRLLQGDVGCGKTVVAACCALMTIESGFAVALMAPTDILAEQHFRNFKLWFEPLGVPVLMHTGSRKSQRDVGQSGLQPLIIGTHALIESGFSAENLGFVIIDEQHKFGVAQREKLVRKGRYPHLLVMTATPIPRTLGLTLYGDLDISVIDQLPVNRAKIRTFIRSADTLPKVLDFIRSHLKQRRQAYVVYPRVDETSDGTVKAS